jgi:hypothetical protein
VVLDDTDDESMVSVEEAPVVADKPGGAPAEAKIVVLDDTDDDKPGEAITGKKHHRNDGPIKM